MCCQIFTTYTRLVLFLCSKRLCDTADVHEVQWVFQQPFSGSLPRNYTTGQIQVLYTAARFLYALNVVIAVGWAPGPLSHSLESRKLSTPSDHALCPSGSGSGSPQLDIPNGELCRCVVSDVSDAVSKIEVIRWPATRISVLTPSAPQPYSRSGCHAAFDHLTACP